MSGTRPGASLDAGRRDRELAALAAGELVDLLVVGGGVTGAGVALDAASRGLSVALLELGDLAQGTSRWSSKLVHGGLRYLAQGDVRLAHESASERAVLMSRTAPHLVHALPMVLPLYEGTPRADLLRLRAGLRAGDVLRLATHVPAAILPPSRRLSRVETLRLVPGLRTAGLRGGLLTWEGQLVDDARLVVGLARTAAAYGARVLTRCAVTQLAGDGARVSDTLGGTEFDVRARGVVNAAGVWAGSLAGDIRLRPSRGAHLVVASARLGMPTAGLTVPVPGESARFLLVLPQPDGRTYVGLTDSPLDGEPPPPTCPPVVEPHELEFLLATLGPVLARPLRGEDVLGTYAGLRPLLDDGRAADDAARTADLSRRHAVRVGTGGVVSVVGGKLTTYRRMAQDAVDTVVAVRGLSAGPCRTRRLPLVGAAPAAVLDRVPAPGRLVRRYGTEATSVVAEAGGDGDLLAPLADGTDITPAELLFGLRHEGALDADDLLDRRTRIGLVPADRERLRPLVESYLSPDESA